MKRTEAIIIIIIGILVALRLLFGGWFNSPAMISIVLLSIYYLLFGVFIFNNIRIDKIFSQSNKSRLNILNISTGVSMGVIYSFCALSIMFALCFYTNMDIMLFISACLTFVSIVFFLFYYFRKKRYNDTPRNFYQYLIRSGVFFLLCLFLLLTPIENRLEVLFHNYPEFIEAYQNYKDNPEDKEAEEELRKQRNRFR